MLAGSLTGRWLRCCSCPFELPSCGIASDVPHASNQSTSHMKGCLAGAQVNVKCRAQLDLFNACLARGSIVASMRAAAKKSTPPCQESAANYVRVLLATCQTTTSGAPLNDIKLNVIMRSELLDNTPSIQHACAKLRAETPADTLQAIQRGESTCALEVSCVHAW
jgi:hypothetical protein